MCGNSGNTTWWKFREYNMALPSATQWYANASMGMVDAGAGNLFIPLALLAADGVLLWFLLREHRTLAWIWFLAVVILLLLLAGGGEFTMMLAERKLDEALGRR
jgi:hypothetical protein